MTRETLDALPVGTVVLDRGDNAWRKIGSSLWLCLTTRDVRSSINLLQYGPITVLLTPTQADAQTAEAVREARVQALRDAADDVMESHTAWEWAMRSVQKWLRARADREEGRS